MDNESGRGSITPTRLARYLRSQGEACADLGSSMYAEMLELAALDVECHGPVERVLARPRQEDPFESALALRFLGAVHRLVLTGRAPGLAPHYPSAGGDGDARAAYTALRELLETDADAVRRLMQSPPQTNEVGRSAALLGGLLHVAAQTRQPIRLVEIGASAGLNLRADRFRYEGEGGSWGAAASPVRLADAWRGSAPPLEAPLEIVSREGTDVAPIDPLSEEGRLTLTSYVWPDQTARLDRLRGAIEIAGTVPVVLRQASARETLAGLEVVPGTTTVVWHSVMWQYLDEDEQVDATISLENLGHDGATGDARLAHLTLEPHPMRVADKEDYPVRLRVWPGGELQELGTAWAHGTPVTWR